MNAKLWLCVLMGVLVAHLSLIFIVGNIRTAGKPPPRPVEPTFTTSTTTFTNPQGEKLKVIHEFTVQTEFADPIVLEKLPVPPSSDAALSAKTGSPAAAD